MQSSANYVVILVEMGNACINRTRKLSLWESCAFYLGLDIAIKFIAEWLDHTNLGEILMRILCIPQDKCTGTRSNVYVNTSNRNGSVIIITLNVH